MERRPDCTPFSCFTCTFMEALYEECSIEGTNEGQEVSLFPSDKQTLVQFCGFGDDLETGEASNPPLQIDKGLEIGDSSRLELVSGCAKSWDVMFIEASVVSNKNVIVQCHAISSLGLFFVEKYVLRFQSTFSFGVVDFGVFHTSPLHINDGQELLIESAVREDTKKEEEDNWGFDEPTCIIDANIQENIDKAMVKIAAVRAIMIHKQKFEEHEVPDKSLGTCSTPKQDGYFFLIQQAGYGEFCKLLRSLS